MGTIYINGSEEGGQFRLGEEDRQTQGKRDELCAREEAIVRHARASQRACVRKHWK